MTKYTETTVQITPDTDLREHLRPGDRVRIEFEVGPVEQSALSDVDCSNILFVMERILTERPIAILRPAEPTIVEQIQALAEGTRFIIYWLDGTSSYRIRQGEGYLDPECNAEYSLELSLTRATRIEVLPDEVTL